MPDDVKLRRMAVIGAGKMGEALTSALVGSGVVGAEGVVATAKHRPRLDHMKRQYAVETSLDNTEAVAVAEVILLCVKPQIAASVIEEIRDTLKPD